MKDYRQKIETGRFYHVFNRGINSEIIFKCKPNYDFFLQRSKEILPESMEVFAWCLMPTHFHLLIRVKDNGDPVFSFKRLFTSYSKAINKQEGRHGSLFEKPFRRLLINSEDYLRQLVIYIHNNPVHHGYTEKPEKWKFSSYHDFFTGTSSFIEKNEVVSWFDDIENLIYSHKSNIEPDFDLSIE